MQSIFFFFIIFAAGSPLGATIETPRSTSQTRLSREITVLEGLTERCCSSTPKFLGHEVNKQTEDEHVPGGYTVWILMELEFLMDETLSPKSVFSRILGTYLTRTLLYFQNGFP